MALSTVTLSCTGSGTATVKKLPSRALNATSTTIPKLLRLPGRKLTATLTSSPIIALITLGIDTFDIIEGKRKWIVNGVDRIQLGTKKRFTFLVRGKPYG